MHPDIVLELARATHRERLEAARALGGIRQPGRRPWLRRPGPPPGGWRPS